MSEWQSIHGKNSKQNTPEVKEKWRTPEEEWVKVNVDGATSKGGATGGAGMVFRNSQGAFWEVFAMSFHWEVTRQGLNLWHAEG